MPERRDLIAAALVGTGLGLTAGAVWLHDYFEGERLLQDLVDEARLTATDLYALDRYCATNPRRSNLVVTLSTIPSRLPLLQTTLKSLLRQTVSPAQIRLNLPLSSRRESRAYVLPAWLTAMVSVQVVRCDRDWGPATKLIPSLETANPDQELLVVDDDRVYAAHLVEHLGRLAKQLPDAAVGLSGWVVPDDLVDRPTTVMGNLLMRPPCPVRATRLRAPKQVDVLQGLSGYVVRPRFFDVAALTDYSTAPDAAFYADDVWISAHCRVPKLVVPMRRTNFPIHARGRFYRRTSLGLRNRGGGGLHQRTNSILLRHLGAHVWRTNRSGAPSVRC
jgi:hypothetical protein